MPFHIMSDPNPKIKFVVSEVAEGKYGWSKNKTGYKGVEAQST